MMTMKKIVFVLEDNPELRELFTILLEEECYLVSAFPTVSMFNHVISYTLPDVFLLDVMLPDGNGADICQELKLDPRTSHIPIIMMSANNSLAEIKYSCNADDYISKPFDIYDFIKKVNQYAN